MIENLYYGIDIGTSVTKGIVIDTNGDTIAKYSVIRDSILPYDRSAEEVWWNEFRTVTCEIVKILGCRSKNIRSIGITAMVPNIIMLNKDGHSISKTRLYYEDFAIDIEKELDNELQLGKWQNEYLSKLIYLKNELGYDWDSLKIILSTHSYIVWKLTGVFSCDYGTATECGIVYDSEESKWNKQLLDNYEIDADLLPNLYNPSEVVGNILEDVSCLLGLSNDIKVVAGSCDSIGSIIGAGLNKTNDVLIYYGTYNCSAILCTNIKDFILGRSHISPIKWVVSVPRSGPQLMEISKLITQVGNNTLAMQTLDALAEESSPGANGVIFLQCVDLLRSNISTEPSGCFLNISLKTKQEDICRAILEAFGYALLYFWESEEMPMKPWDCYASGGGTKSKVWTQIISDITGVTQKTNIGSDQAFGSAILATLIQTEEVFDNIIAKRNKSSCIIVPDSKNKEAYNMSYGKYCEFIRALNM